MGVGVGVCVSLYLPVGTAWLRRQQMMRFQFHSIPSQLQGIKREESRYSLDMDYPPGLKEAT